MQENLSVSDAIQAPYRNIFNFDTFNQMQTILVPRILNDSSNLVIASPTGSGKTVLHELAIVKLLMSKSVKDTKCVFIAPNKALCQQRAAEWKDKFGRLGVT